jgi:hypothetical protein
VTKKLARPHGISSKNPSGPVGSRDTPSSWLSWMYSESEYGSYSGSVYGRIVML